MNLQYVDFLRVHLAVKALKPHSRLFLFLIDLLFIYLIILGKHKRLQACNALVNRGFLNLICIEVTPLYNMGHSLYQLAVVARC